MSAFDKGLLKQEEIDRFKSYLDSRGIAWTDGKGEYQLMQVHLIGVWQPVTRNAKGVISTPPGLNGLIFQFKQVVPRANPADTERLDYLINNCAVVREYTANEVPFFYLYYEVTECTQTGIFNSPREAIDAAIAAAKEQA